MQVYVPSARAVLPPQYGGAGGLASGAASSWGSSWGGHQPGHDGYVPQYPHHAAHHALYAQNMMMSPWRAYDGAAFQRASPYGAYPDLVLFCPVHQSYAPP